MRILLGYLFTYIYIFFILISADKLKRKYKLSVEFSRKYVHVFVSFAWIIMIYFFHSSWHLMIPPITFVILNYISYKNNLFSAMERINNKSLGTVYYPISMLILSIITVLNSDFTASFGIGLFIMAIGDGLAPYFGSIKQKYKFNNNKTILGIITVFVSALFISVIFSNIYNLPLNIFDVLIISISSSILEFVGLKGYDNLLLPLGSAIISYLLIVF